jgi:hypothetical protein
MDYLIEKYQITATSFPPKSNKRIKVERVHIVKDYLDGNLKRFLRKHYRYSKNQLVYSVDFKEWAKDNRKNLVKYLKKYHPWPLHTITIVNILKTLVNEFDLPWDKNTLKLSIIIDDLFWQDIDEYRQARYNREIQIKGFKLPDKRKSWKEQKARGFIHINDFEDYDNKFAHVYSNIKSDYVYPVNFRTQWMNSGTFSDLYKDNLDLPTEYTGHYLVAMPWTRINIPPIPKKLPKKKKKTIKLNF